MNINEVMHQLAMRKHPEYNWKHEDSHEYHWILTGHLDGFPMSPWGNSMCLLCGGSLPIGGVDMIVISNEHAMQHLKEHNLLPLL